VDTNGDFYFLEINPRIQVEHGLTEMLTGIDIVREQIHIAQGFELSLHQNDITGSGHAIEARIYAEDPENNMLPSPGKIHYFSVPSGENTRIDTGVENGSEIFPDFDPLIAKIMVCGTSRQDAIQRMQHAIRQSVITGVHHNLPLHARIFSDDDFVNNQISTTWLDDKYAGISASLTERRLSADHIVLGIAASIIVLFRKPVATDSPWNSGFWRNIRQIRFRVGGKLTELEYYQARKDEFCFFHDSREYKVNSIKLDDFRLEFRLNETINLWYIVPEKDGIIGLSDGHTEYSVERYALLQQDYALIDEIAESQSNTVIAPQPGTILEIRVSEGQQVSRGDYLLTIESMKLENTILARQAGIVKKINIKAGDRVKKNEPLIYLQETITNKLN